MKGVTFISDDPTCADPIEALKEKRARELRKSPGVDIDEIHFKRGAVKEGVTRQSVRRGRKNLTRPERED